MATTVWRGRLAFGLVAIPVRLYKAARRERLRFHRVYRPPEPDSEIESEPEAEADEEPSPEPGNLREMPPPAPALGRVRNLAVQESGSTPVPPAETLRGYEVGKNRYVALRPQEVAALRPATSSEIDIVEMTRLAEIDPVYFDTSYYVAPDPGGEKAYALLAQALRQSGYAAMGTLAMHGREHAVVIRPGSHGLLLHTLFYANEVRSNDEYRPTEAVSKKELDLAQQVVRSMAAKFDPAHLKDSFEERLRELVHSRAAEAMAPAAQKEARTAAPVVDIMEALRRSLERARKPAQRETSAPKHKKNAR